MEIKTKSKLNQIIIKVKSLTSQDKDKNKDMDKKQNKKRIKKILLYYYYYNKKSTSINTRTQYV